MPLSYTKQVKPALARIRAGAAVLIARRAGVGLLTVLAAQEALFVLAIWMTGAMPPGVHELHSFAAILAFASGSVSAIAMLGLAGFAWLSLVNLLPWRRVRRAGSFLLYLAVYLPLFNFGFFLFSRHLVTPQLLRDAPTYFSQAPPAHVLGLAGAVLVFLFFVVVSWRARLLGEAWRDGSGGTGRAPLRETMQMTLLAALGLALSSGVCAVKNELSPAVSTAGHLITGYLPNVRLALATARSSQEAFLRAQPPTDTSGLLPASEVETYLKGLSRHTPPGRPNILVVMLESVPVDHVSAFGYQRKTTPNLDRLAAESLVFDRCWAVANESKHAQTSVHTSMLPMRGRNDDFSHVGYRRLPWWIVFKMLGYRTAYISTQNEEWLSMKSFQLDGQVPPDLYLHSLDIPEGPFYEGTLRKKDAETVNHRLFQYLDQAKRDGRPFVLMTNYQRTHYPFELPKSWSPPFTPLANLGAFRAWRPDEIEQGKNSFDSALAYVDAQLGELIRHLDASGLGTNTIVAVMSDHGIGFEPGVHPVSESLKDPYIHVPFLIRYPGRRVPTHFSGDVSTIDLFPTLLGLLGAPGSPAWEGQDVLALGADGCAKRAVFAGSLIWLQRWLAIRGEGKVLVDLDEQTRQVFGREDKMLQQALPMTGWATGLLRELLSTLQHHIHFYESPVLFPKYMIRPGTSGLPEIEGGGCRPGPADLDAGLRALLLHGEWYFEKEGVGRLRILSLLPDGRIRSIGLPDHPAESFWEVQLGEVRFLDKTHGVATRFTDLSVRGGVVTFKGLHHEDPEDVRLLRQARMAADIAGQKSQ